MYCQSEKLPNSTTSKLLFKETNLIFFSLFLAQYSFPYIKKRLRVIQREFYDLSPIEVALDEMRLRVKDIAEAVRTVPTDLKKLQLRLQVCKNGGLC